MDWLKRTLGPRPSPEPAPAEPAALFVPPEPDFCARMHLLRPVFSLDGESVGQATEDQVSRAVRELRQAMGGRFFTIWADLNDPRGSVRYTARRLNEDLLDIHLDAETVDFDPILYGDRDVLSALGSRLSRLLPLEFYDVVVVTHQYTINDLAALAQIRLVSDPETGVQLEEGQPCTFEYRHETGERTFTHISGGRLKPLA